MPQRQTSYPPKRTKVRPKLARIDTTVSAGTVERIDQIARAIERTGRRFVSRTEVAELAIDWAFGARLKGKSWPQPDRESVRDYRSTYHVSEKSMAKWRQLGKDLLNHPDYVRPPRSIEGAVSMGETLDWCVAGFHAVLVKTKGERNAKAKQQNQ